MLVLMMKSGWALKRLVKDISVSCEIAVNCEIKWIFFVVKREFGYSREPLLKIIICKMRINSQ